MKLILIENKIMELTKCYIDIKWWFKYSVINYIKNTFLSNSKKEHFDINYIYAPPPEDEVNPYRKNTKEFKDFKNWKNKKLKRIFLEDKYYKIYSKWRPSYFTLTEKKQYYNKVNKLKKNGSKYEKNALIEGSKYWKYRGENWREDSRGDYPLYYEELIQIANFLQSPTTETFEEFLNNNK
jgi:hypothetical protein